MISGMNRELWEESVGKRGVSYREFCACLDTRITGYFRWLTKGGKSEFVGVSRLGGNKKGKPMAENLVPEESEVLNGEKIPAGNMWKLQEALTHRLDKIRIRAEAPQAQFSTRENTYSVSCTMAMLALQEVCRGYCTEKCKQSCKKESCDRRPFQVLFEGGSSAEKQEK